MSTPDPVIFPYAKSGTDVRGSVKDIVREAHIHTEDGLCYKDRYGTCNAPKFPRPEGPTDV